MNQEEKRVKIAECLGWGKIEAPNGKRGWLKDGVMADDGASLHFLHELPDYFDDLNACHEMEKALSDERVEDYFHRLCDFMQKGSDYEFHANKVDSYIFHATAAQRAEAFGLTLKLWEAGE